MQYFSKYRILKTSWGIAIDIKGHIKEIHSAENIFDVSQLSLSPSEKEQVLLGLKSLTAFISESRYLIEIQEVVFNYCDFQTEALYWASRDWLSKALNIQISNPEISYNPKENKYAFYLNH